MTPDTLTYEGALKLSMRLIDYWRKRGYALTPSVGPVKMAGKQETGCYHVRSDMVNGRPIRRVDPNKSSIYDL